MKRFILSLSCLMIALGFAYNAYAVGWKTGSSVWKTANGNCQWICIINQEPEQHWVVNFNGAQCGGTPKYNGSNINEGNWWGSQGNQYQLTKSWMRNAGCLSINPCWACFQTGQWCGASNFTAYCQYP